jgi:hypothetical protein
VINLSADKPRVLAEAFRVLKPGGRFAVSDIAQASHPAQRTERGHQVGRTPGPHLAEYRDIRPGRFTASASPDPQVAMACTRRSSAPASPNGSECSGHAPAVRSTGGQRCGRDGRPVGGARRPAREAATAAGPQGRATARYSTIVVSRWRLLRPRRCPAYPAVAAQRSGGCNPRHDQCGSEQHWASPGWATSCRAEMARRPSKCLRGPAAGAYGRSAKGWHR